MKKKKQDNPNYAVGYCRFSSAGQREESIDSQQRNIRNYANNQTPKLQIINWYSDEAKTGTTTKRDNFKRMIEDAKKGKFRYVIVNKMDRYARNTYESIKWKFELSKYGVLIKSATEPIDDSPAGKMLESQLMSIAQFYSDNLSQEVKRGMDENAYNAVFNGGNAPLGYKKVDRIDPRTGQLCVSKRDVQLTDVAIDETEADAVRYVFDSIIAKRPFTEIVERLNNMGLMTKKTKKNPVSIPRKFGLTSIENIARNEKYIGVYAYNKKKAVMKNLEGEKTHIKNDEDKIIRTERPEWQIIPKETFEAVQKIMDSRKYKSNKTIENYLLSGKIECGECGAIYRGCRQRRHNDKYHKFYMCQSPRNEDGVPLPMEQRCQNCTVSRDVVEKFVMEQIKELVFDVKNVQAVAEDYNAYIRLTTDSNESIIRRIESEIADVDRKIDVAVSNLMVEHTQTIADRMRELIARLEVEKDALHNRLFLEQQQSQLIKIQPREFKKAFAKAKEYYEKGGFENKKRLVDTFLNRVVVFNERVEVYINILPNFILGGINTEITLETLRKGLENIEKGTVSVPNSCVETSLTTPLGRPKPRARVLLAGEEVVLESMVVRCVLERHKSVVYTRLQH